MSVRSLDALLGSAVFWGIVSVVLFLLTLLFGSRMQGIAKAIVLAFALLTGSYGLFRWWSEDTPQDWRLLASLLFLYSGVILLIYFWTDLQRVASRPVNGEPIRTGKPVASVSMFDVGGLPTHEVIPDPPDWVEPATKVNLIFQDSPLLTDRVKDQITRDLSAFREYFLRLGIPVPIEFPAIGVSKGPGSSEAHVLDALPPYRSNMKVAAGWFLNRRSFTEQYANYMIEQALTLRIPQHPEISGLLRRTYGTGQYCS
jgi:hypothetical protein